MGEDLAGRERGVPAGKDNSSAPGETPVEGGAGMGALIAKATAERGGHAFASRGRVGDEFGHQVDGAPTDVESLRAGVVDFEDFGHFAGGIEGKGDLMGTGWERAGPGEDGGRLARSQVGEASGSQGIAIGGQGPGEGAAGGVAHIGKASGDGDRSAGGGGSRSGLHVRDGEFRGGIA